MRGLSLAAASGGHSSSRCAGLLLSRPLLLRGTGSRHAGSEIVAHGPSCSAACGILPDQGSNPRSLHWQADSQPLRHQGSPKKQYFKLMDLLVYHFRLNMSWKPEREAIHGFTKLHQTLKPSSCKSYKSSCKSCSRK